MGVLKAPGPDGFQGLFYHSFWDTLVSEVNAVVWDIVNGNAFVAGRQIQDNIGIAHEMFHFLKLRKTKCKFEMHKAYNRVEWDFLEAMMEKMGFCSQWRYLMMGCVKSVDFAMILNG
ncbi:uncharacterized protein [Pyrus communis]|uniref:uncharacterized protein n=1 Tax=Pyrus communis TaxID=23211 RepID=UPI0035BF186C